MIMVPRFRSVRFGGEILCFHFGILPEIRDPCLSHSLAPFFISAIIDVRILGPMEEPLGRCSSILHLTTKIEHEASTLSDHSICQVRKP